MPVKSLALDATNDARVAELIQSILARRSEVLGYLSKR